MTTYVDNGLGSIQMMPDEVDYMDLVIAGMPVDGKFVEWGSGGSTLRWLDSLTQTQKLISIEHNRDWYLKVSNKIAEVSYTKNFQYLLVNVESEHFKHGYGTPEEETPFNVKEYVNPSENIFDADVFFIDGIARGACLASVLLNRTKPKSLIYIHDYVLRPMAYEWITQFCEVEIVGTTLAKIARG